MMRPMLLAADPNGFQGYGKIAPCSPGKDR